MVDIARIGFSADTAPLKDAKASLDALVPAAVKAERGVNNFNRAAAGVTAGVGGASAGIRSFGSAATGAASGTDRLTRAALSAGTGMGTVQRAAVGANAQVNVLGNTVKRVGTNFVSADAHVEAYRASLLKLPGAANGARTSLDRLGASANDNINQLQSTPGNIAAQFQDIGVTAAGGMQPLLIALQQGTQLSAAMQGGLGNLWDGIKQLLNPTALLTIAFVFLIAQLIQYAMEAFKASGETDKLGAALDKVQMTTSAFGDAQSALGNVIDLTTGKINTQSEAMMGLARSQLEMIRARALDDRMVASRTLREDARAKFSLSRAFTVGLTGPEAGGASAAATNPSVTAGLLANVMSGSINSTAAIDELERLRNAGQLTEERFISLTGAVSSFGMAAENLEEYQRARAALEGDRTALTPYLTPPTSRTSRGGKSDAEKAADAYADLIRSSQQRITALQTETAALGMSERAGMLYRNQQELIAQAVSKNIPLTTVMRLELDALAHALTGAGVTKAMADATKAFEGQQQVLRDQAALIGLTGLELDYTRIRQDLVNQAVRDGVIEQQRMNGTLQEYLGLLSDRAMTLARGGADNNTASFLAGAVESHNENIAAMRRERGEIGLIGRELTAYRHETELLAAARKQNLDLLPEALAGLKQQAAEYALMRQEVDMTRMRVELFRDAQMGFVTDLLGGLRQGQSAWEAFGNAVMNVADKIFNKLLEVVTSEAFGSFTGQGGGGGGGGFFGAIMNGFKLFTGATGPSAALAGDVNATMNANSSLFARGGTFGVERFAQGGAFTNGLYTKPTLFKFAGGAALGEMGEAGPEAVMPLKRGPNGSLGVEVHRAEPVQVVVTTNDDRFDAYVDRRSGAQVEAAAPTIARAGSKMAQRTAAIRGNRSL